MFCRKIYWELHRLKRERKCPLSRDAWFYSVEQSMGLIDASSMPRGCDQRAGRTPADTSLYKPSASTGVSTACSKHSSAGPHERAITGKLFRASRPWTSLGVQRRFLWNWWKPCSVGCCPRDKGEDRNPCSSGCSTGLILTSLSTVGDSFS